MDHLVKCPFCGETENLKLTLLSTTKGKPWKAIKCVSCGAQGPISKDGLEANRLWQQRTSGITPVFSGRDYKEPLEGALIAGKKVHNKDFVETLAMLIKTSKEITGGRATEMMDLTTHFLRCREICEKHGLMREVLKI